METQGGLYVPAGKERHVFKAPAPRPSLLGNIVASCARTGACFGYFSMVCTSLTYGLLYALTCLDMHASGLDKLAQQKRDEAGGKALPGLGKRTRLDLDDGEEQEPVLSTTERDARNKGQARHYRSSRIDTPSHPGMQGIFRNDSQAAIFASSSTCCKLSCFWLESTCAYLTILAVAE